MKKGLAFSGGKDSWACLWLHEKELDDIGVIWVNTGKNYPEALAMIQKAKAMCPNFVEVQSDQQAQNDKFGLPSDVLPVNWTYSGQLVRGKKDVKIQSYLSCCWDNIGIPLQEVAKEAEITHLIRGQRNDEKYKATSRNGDVVNGITYIHPIENWTRQQVLDYLATKMDVPEHFVLEHSSMDCYDCTGYWEASKDRIEYTKERHPALYDEYKVRMDIVKDTLSESMKGLQNG